MLSEENKFHKQLPPNFTSDVIQKFGTGTLIPPGIAPLPSRLSGYHPTSFLTSLILIHNL